MLNTGFPAHVNATDTGSNPTLAIPQTTAGIVGCRVGPGGPVRRNRTLDMSVCRSLRNTSGGTRTPDPNPYRLDSLHRDGSAAELPT